VSAREALDRFVAIIRAQPEVTEDVASMASRAAALVDDLKIVLAAHDPAFVHYVEARGRGVSLRASPIEVSKIVRNAILGDRSATVLTSATLAVDGGFDYVKTRLGLDDAESVVSVRV
jgi:ATP-dependent DNA helicase DinG